MQLLYQEHDLKSQKVEKKCLEEELNKVECHSIPDFFQEMKETAQKMELIPCSVNTKKGIGKERHLLVKENIYWQEMKWDN